MKTALLSFPDGPREDEHIRRVAHEADTDGDLHGYVVMISSDDGVSFKFAVPTDGAALDQMIGALTRVQYRLMQYQEGER